jgi:alanine racemase
VAAFTEAVALAERAGARPEVRHLANSGGLLDVPQSRFDLVRAGIAIYGLSPVADPAAAVAIGLRPAMTLTARLALTKRVSAGTGVSYGHRYQTPIASKLGLVPIGYADGIGRAAANAAEVLVAGRDRTARCTIAGTVSMDQFVVDLGADDDDNFAAGDEVVLFGTGERGEPTADDWARALDTISYEIVSRVGVRVPRVYEGG